MKKGEGYNGWSNYETWVVNLWMDNDQCDHDYWLEIAKECDARCNSIDAGIDLAEQLEQSYKDHMQDVLVAAKQEASVWADLLGAALNEVDWREIADALLAEEE